jgi:hypothetical protein
VPGHITVTAIAPQATFGGAGIVQSKHSSCNLIVNAAAHAQSVPAEEPREPLLREMCEREAVSAPIPYNKGAQSNEVNEAFRNSFIDACMTRERFAFYTLEQIRPEMPKEIYGQCLQEGASYSDAMKCVEPYFGSRRYSPPPSSKSE